MLHLITNVRTEDYQPIARYENNNQLLLDDIADAYIKAMNVFYKLGCRNLQLDDTSWGEFCAEDKRAAYKARGLDLDQIAKDYVYMVNKSLMQNQRMILQLLCIFVVVTSVQPGSRQAVMSRWRKLYSAPVALTVSS
ncbi:methionine synthase II (cobalamin-independent) [Actinobacillus equuli]|nr:methionine synthase II (cobalamin-independent) [Actinobacillus equuli]